MTRRSASWLSAAALVLVPSAAPLTAQDSITIAIDDRSALATDHTRFAHVNPSADHQIAVWDLRSRKASKTLVLPDGGMARSVAIAGDASRLAAGTEQGQVAIWRLSDPPEFQMVSCTVLNKPVTAVWLSPTGKLCAALQRSIGDLTIIDTAARKVVGRLPVPRGRARGLAFASDEQGLLSVSSTDVRRWSRQGPAAGEAVADGLDVLSVVVSPDQRILAAHLDNGLELWDVADFVRTDPLDYRPDDDVHFAPDSRHMFVLRKQPARRSLDAWDLRGGAAAATFLRADTSAALQTPAALAVHDAQLLYAGEDGRQLVRNSLDLRSRTVLDQERSDLYGVGAIQSMALSGDGREVLLLREGGQAQFVAVPDGRLVGTSAVEFAPAEVRYVGGDATIFARSDSEVQLWSSDAMKSAAAVRMFTLPEQFSNAPMHDLEFTPDGRRLAVKHERGTTLFDAESGEPVVNITQRHLLLGFSRKAPVALLVDSDERYHYDLQSGTVERIVEPQMGGVGISLKLQGNRMLVEGVVPGSPAAQSKKLKAGDEILRVAEGADGDFREVPAKKDRTLSLDMLTKRLKGPIGTIVRLEMTRAGSTPIEVELVRHPLSTLNGKWVQSGPVSEPDLDDRLVLGMTTDRFALWNPESGRIVALFETQSVESDGQFAVSSDSRRYAVLGKLLEVRGAGVEVFDVASGRQVTFLPLPIDAFRAIGFNADGSRLLVATARTLEVVDYRRGRIAHSFPILEMPRRPESDDAAIVNPALQAARDNILFTPDPGERLAGMAVSSRNVAALGTDRGRTILLDATSGQVLRTWSHEPRSISILAFSDDGNQLAYVVGHAAYTADVTMLGTNTPVDRGSAE